MTENKRMLDLEEDRDYYKTKCASLETGMFNLEKENAQLKQALREQLEENGNSHCIELLDKIFDLEYDEWQRKMNKNHTYDYIDWGKILKEKGDENDVSIK